TDSAVLGRYDSVVVVDASADSFPPAAMAGIADSVKSLGKGLVAVGGPNAYGPGGWQNTPLEQALPVRMDLPNRKEKPKVAVVLGDGDAELGGAGQDDIQSVLTSLKQADVTTSTIGVDTHNQPQFMAYMQDIARWGGGRFYESNDPSQVPQLFLKESQVALRP